MATTSLTNTNINDTYVGVLHAKGAPIPPTGLNGCMMALVIKAL